MKPYCSGSACDDVTISGDHNANGIFDADDVQRFMGVPDDASRTAKYWTFDGNPLVSSGSWSQPKYMHWIKANGRMIRNEGGSGDNSGWGFFTWEDMEIAQTSELTWQGGNFYDTGCPGGQAFTFFLQRSSGDLTFVRNKFHLACQTVFRLNNHYSGGYTIRIDDNEFFNVGSSLDLNNFSGGSTFVYSFQRNYLHDVSLSSFDLGISNATVADNIFACEGVYRVESDWRCKAAFNVGDDNCDTCLDCHDITIERNKVYGRGESGTSGGWFNEGIHICSDLGSRSNPNVTIRNNLVWHIRSFDNLNCGSAANAGIVVTSPDPVTIINNTVFDSTNGIVIARANHTVKNNISARNGIAFVECNDAAGIYSYNNFHNTSGTIVCQNDTTSDGCNGSTYACSGVGSFGSNNKCATPKFETCGYSTWCANLNSNEATWDLRLHSSDTSDINAGTTGVTEDFERQARDSQPDIGADEYGGTSPPTAVTATLSLSPPPPASGGVPVLKAGTYTVTLSSSIDLVAAPAGLVFTDSQGAGSPIPLSGAAGRTFTGAFVVGVAMSDGRGMFSLPADAMVDADGNTGNQITSGSDGSIDQTPPSAPVKPVAQ
jgi:parallel beta-helix repeat protein